MSKKKEKEPPAPSSVNEGESEQPVFRIKNYFQTEDYIDESILPWYRKTWVILTFMFTPVFFIGIYLLMTQKHYTILFKGLVIGLFGAAIIVTILQINGIDPMQKMPFYTPIERPEE